MDSTVGADRPKADAIVWFHMTNPTVQQITADGWDPERRPIKVANLADSTEPADKRTLWWTGPRTDLLDWHLYEYNTNDSRWEEAHICACVARDDFTWFYQGKGTTFNVLEDADALSSANISVFPDAGGGEVEIYYKNTDPANLIGTAKKLVFNENAPEPYLESAANPTIISIRPQVVSGGGTDPVVTQAVYVNNVRAASEDDMVTVNWNADGQVTSFEGNTPNVIFDVSWVQPQGKFASVPAIGTDRAVPLAPGMTTGTITTTVATGTVTINYDTKRATVAATVLNVANPVSNQRIGYPVGQTAVRNSVQGQTGQEATAFAWSQWRPKVLDPSVYGGSLNHITTLEAGDIVQIHVMNNMEKKYQTLLNTDQGKCSLQVVRLG